jgi:Uma2 family endonuclease
MTVGTLTKKYTIDDYIALPNDGKRYELIEGELVEIPLKYVEHWIVASQIHTFLGIYVMQNNLGDVLGSDARYAIVPGKDTVRLADVSFIQTSRIQRNVMSMDFAPDLAVEVLSDSNTYTEIETKIAQYFAKGGQLVWVVNLELKEVYIYRVGSNLRETLTINDTLSADPVVKGFKLPVKQIFE